MFVFENLSSIILTILGLFFFQRLPGETMKSSPRNDRPPAHVLDISIHKIPPESDFVVQNGQKIDIKTEIIIDDRDDLNDIIYGDSVSIHLFISQIENKV